MNIRLLLAIAASLVVLICAPVIGQIRGAIQEAFPEYYRAILLTLVGGTVAVFAIRAVTTIRNQRALRYGLVAGAIGIGIVYSLVMATGNVNVDAVERFHFVEYGVLALLFHRAWRTRGRGAAVVLTGLAVLIVGTLDESIQWFVPVRVGEWHDVLLNEVATACGLLYIAALEPPDQRGAQLRAASPNRTLAAMATLATAIFGAFFYAVHVGYEIHDPVAGTFRSRYSADQLLALSADRTRAWKMMPPTTLRRYSKEDQYMAEGLWHVQRRNEGSAPGGVWANWKENQILEKYFAPVLDYPTYNTPTGARWPQEQRDNVMAAAAADTRAFVSTANPFPIYPWLGR